MYSEEKVGLHSLQLTSQPPIHGKPRESNFAHQIQVSQCTAVQVQ